MTPHFFTAARLPCLLGTFIILLNIAVSSSIHADEAVKHGAVIARSVVLDKNGQPILVEYNEDGSEGNEIGIPDEYKNRVADLPIISAFEYHQQENLLKDFKDRYKDTLAKDAELLSREEFYGRGGFPTADGAVTLQAQAPEYVKSVLVRGRSNRISKDPASLILLAFRVDLTQHASVPDSGSVLLNLKGQVIKASTLNIGPRVGFYGDPTKKQEFYSGTRKNDDTIFGPVPGVKVSVSEAYPGSVAVTDENGKWNMRFHTGFCPAYMELTTDIWAELHYANFSANGTPVLPYYLRRQDWTGCWDPLFLGAATLGQAMAYAEILAAKAVMSNMSYNLDLKVDVMFLSGKVGLKNPDGSDVTVGDTTEYDADPVNTDPIAQQQYDFDGDGKPDQSLVGTVTNQPQADGSVKRVFAPDPDQSHATGNVQAVYFSSHTDATEPDVIRQADTQKKLPNGDATTTKNSNSSNVRLKSISKDDLKKTDLLVFRESTGDLIMERQGLRDAEIDGRVQEGLGKDDKYFFYRLMLRGPQDSSINVGGTSRQGTWTEWSTKNKLAEPFRERESDLLKPGEWIRLVIINRATGYMTAERIQLTDASKNKGSVLSLPIPDISLTPPNLKVWAERNYTQENGLDKNKESKNNMIGAEGAGLTSDDDIIVYTEWLDNEGRPLPEGLGVDNGEQYGLTGRLAKVTGSNQITAVSANGMANFPIAPGKHTQVLKIRDNLTTPEHYYIHVSGTQQDEKPDFSTNTSAEAPFDSRPKHPTPFLTPLYDENSDWKAFSDWNQASKVFEAQSDNGGGDAVKPVKPLPTYVWSYRPEYQFSQFTLEVNSILRKYTDEAGEEHESELLTGQQIDGQIPTIRSTDDLITIFYSLIGAQNDRLTAFDGQQHLVLSLGAEEITADVSADGQININNLSHIDRLDPTDLLTIRLYLNEDAGNTLWQWAFTRNGLHVYFEVPGNTETRQGKTENDIEILSLLEDGEPGMNYVAKVPEPVVRTLGGMRLRYRYIPPSLEDTRVEKVTWKINHEGRYCTDYGVENLNCTKVAAGNKYELTKSMVGDENWSVYWEPTNGDETLWSNWSGTSTNDAGTSGTLVAEYSIPNFSPVVPRLQRKYERTFSIKTRELKPETDATKVMKGSDVQMLEAMLWQLGISPSNGPGIGGRRLGVGLKNQYISDVPSVEKMVQRFKNRSFESSENGIKGIATSQQPIVDNQTASQLGKVWKDYYSAIHQVPQEQFRFNQISDAYWTALKTAAEGTVDFINPSSSVTIAWNYDDATHQAAMRVTGSTATTKQAFFKAWVSKENDRQWGANNTSYRISEGGADEVGSIGFSQLWFAYMYGKLANCTELNNINMYHPQNNLMGFAVWAGVNACGGSMYKAFNTNAYAVANSAATTKNLLGYQCTETSSGAAQANHICTYAPDKYERLVKGLVGYNAGANAERLSKCSLPEWLAGGVTRSGVDCQSTRTSGKGLDYAFTILHGTVFPDAPDANKLALPYREFVWIGDRYDANLTLANGNPDPNAGKPKWCFVYGEKEWRDGKVWSTTKDDASDTDVLGNPKTPIGRVSCQ